MYATRFEEFNLLFFSRAKKMLNQFIVFVVAAAVKTSKYQKALKIMQLFILEGVSVCIYVQLFKVKTSLMKYYGGKDISNDHLKFLSRWASNFKPPSYIYLVICCTVISRFCDN